MSFPVALGAAICALAVGTPAYAGLILSGQNREVFFAESLTPAESVTSTVAATRADFISVLQSSPGSYGFEQLAPGATAGTTGLAIDFNNGTNGTGVAITATITGNGQVMDRSEQGRFNTTSAAAGICDADPATSRLPDCSKYWRVQTGPSGSFSINFSRGVSAFGFYGTDIGDFHGSLKAILTPIGGGPFEEVDIFSRPSGSTPSGTLLFWGFASRNNAYTSIRFATDSPNQADYFGFDDFIVADLAPSTPNRTPEPATLALVGLGLLGAAAARRRR